MEGITPWSDLVTSRHWLLLRDLIDGIEREQAEKLLNEVIANRFYNAARCGGQIMCIRNLRHRILTAAKKEAKQDGARERQGDPGGQAFGTGRFT